MKKPAEFVSNIRATATDKASAILPNINSHRTDIEMYPTVTVHV